jgi:hypothetical protein
MRQNARKAMSQKNPARAKLNGGLVQALEHKYQRRQDSGDLLSSNKTI